MAAQVAAQTAAPEITPFLMFTGEAQAAMDHYVSIFPDSRIDTVLKYGPGQPGAEGTVMHATLTLAGKRYQCIDSPAKHAFGFTPSVSLYVACATEAEVDRIFARLSDGGTVLMPLGEYPFNRRYGWTNDRFGVSWQVGLANV